MREVHLQEWFTKEIIRTECQGLAVRMPAIALLYDEYKLEAICESNCGNGLKQFFGAVLGFEHRASHLLGRG
jgi:hypothetical protein